ncbi:MAG: Flp family type IVb pilin [Geobacteraceae bacterium]
MTYLDRIPGKAKSLLHDEAGQTLVEYGLVLVLIAVVVLLMVKGVGVTTNNTYETINSAVTNAVGS